MAKDGVIQMVFLGEIIAEHISSFPLVRPPSTTTTTAGPDPCPRARSGRRRTAEKAFCALGPVADAFIKGAAARGMTGLARATWTSSPTWRPSTAGRRCSPPSNGPSPSGGSGPPTWSPSSTPAPVCPRPTRPGEALIVELPLVPVRSLSDYAIGGES